MADPEIQDSFPTPPPTQAELTKSSAWRELLPAKHAMAAAMDCGDTRAIEEAEHRLEAIYGADPSLLDDTPSVRGYSQLSRDRYDPNLGGHDF